MAKTFTQMKTNVGNMVHDTSAAFATLIGRWLNDKYRDVWRRGHFSETINNNYTITLVSGTADYNLPNDFQDEMFVGDATDGFFLTRYFENLWWQERISAYSGGSITSGTALRYVILREKLRASSAGYGVISFDPTPNNTHTIVMPYKRKCEDMISLTGTCTTDTANKVIASASTFITSGVKPGMRITNTTDTLYSYVSSVDSETQLTCESDVCPDGNEAFLIESTTQIMDIEHIIEFGACSEAETYKKQFDKASYYLQKYESELAKRLSQERKKINQLYQMIPGNSQAWNTSPFTGWQSYDSL